MQGKFDSSHSKSTSFVRVVNRFALDAHFFAFSPLRFSLLLYFFTSLLLYGEVGGRPARGHFHRQRGWFPVFAPRLQRVLPGRHVLDFIVAALVRHCKIG